MGKTKVKESKKPLTLSKVVVYILLILLAITIIIPVGWVFVASVKQNSEFYGSPWVLPEKIYFQNFIDAWEKASMGTYMLNSVIVTALALLLLIVISLPAAYVLSRFKFKTSKFWNVLFMAGLFINVSYIVVPIFLMLNNWDKTLRQLTGGTFFLNNLFVLALVYASPAETATAGPPPCGAQSAVCAGSCVCVYGASVYDLSFVRIFQIFGKRF